MCGRNVKKLLALSLLSSCFWLSPIFSTTALRAEMMYTISETELNQLQTNFRTLETHSKEKDSQLTALSSQLKTASSQLTEAEGSLKTANEQLAESRKQNEATEKSLAKANQYFKEYEKEAEHKLTVRDRQNRMWKLIAGGFAAAFLYKCAK